MTKRICHMQTLFAKSSIHIDLKHTICRAQKEEPGDTARRTLHSFV